MPNTDAELSLGFNLTQAQNDIKELEKLLKDASKKIEGKGFTSLESRLEAAEKNAKGLSDELSVASTNVSSIADNLKELSAEKQATLTKIADEERGLSKLQRTWNEKYERNPESAGAQRNLAAQAEQNKLIKENRDYIALIEQEEAKLQADYERAEASSQEVLSNYAQQKDIISQTLSDVELSVNANQELAQSTKEEADNLATVKENLDGAKDSAQSFSQSVKDISGEDKNPLNALAESSQECEGKLTALDTIIRSITEDTNALWDRMQSDPATDNIAELIRRYNQLKEAKKTLETLGMPAGADSTYGTILRMIELINSQIRGYKQNLRDVSNEHTKVAETGKQLKSIPPLVSVIKRGFRDWHKDANRARTSFEGMAKTMRTNLKHLITGITKYVFGFRSLFFLVRRLRKYIGEGIQNMAQFNDGNNHVNASITRLLSSLLYLKNAWATAFSPILQFVTPWLEALIDKIAQVGNAFARFLGVLLGQKQVFQAVKVKAADYADGLDNVGGSASGAADKTKKLTDRLAAFDDLNVLGVDRDPDASGRGGGGGLGNKYTPDPNDMFKLVDVDPSEFKGIFDIIDKIKEKIKDSGVIEAFDRLKTAFDKFKDSPIVKTLAEIVLYLADTAFTSALSIVTNLFNLLADILNGDLKTGLQDFKSLLADLTFDPLIALAGVFDKIFGTDIAGWLQGVKKAIKDIDLSKLPGYEKMVSALEDLKLAWDNFKNALKDFWELLDETGVLDVLEKHIVTLVEIGFDILLHELAFTLTLVGDALQIIADILSGDWPAVFDDIKNTLADLNYHPLETVASVLDDIYGTDISGWLDNVHQGIENISFAELVQGIVDGWETIKSAFWLGVGVIASLLGITDEKFNWFSKKVSAFKQFLADTWVAIRVAATNTFNTLAEDIRLIWNRLKGYIETPVNAIISIINVLIGGLEKMVNGIADALNKIKIDIPNWVPDWGGKSVGFNLKHVTLTRVPHLAQGAVIPPNREFMAVLGDQSHGTNIEAPLDTIKQAVAEVLATSGNAEMIQLLQQLIQVVERKNLTIGDKEIGKANARYVNQQRMIRGTSF